VLAGEICKEPNLRREVSDTQIEGIQRGTMQYNKFDSKSISSLHQKKAHHIHKSPSCFVLFLQTKKKGPTLGEININLAELVQRMVSESADNNCKLFPDTTALTPCKKHKHSFMPAQVSVSLFYSHEQKRERERERLNKRSEQGQKS
jgi:hypothetical protein